MGRHTPSSAHSHGGKHLGGNLYSIWWQVDRYHASSPLRHPVVYRRVTDTRGALRFAQRHGLNFQAMHATPPDVQQTGGVVAQGGEG